jgi:L-fucose mutarotase/ribose pyranase (RbsD/FucU family)
MQRTLVSALGTILLTATLAGAQQMNGNWRSILQERLPLYGHRNWIVIADSAYPAQSAEGVETIVTGADHFEVLQAVIRALDASKHVRPNIYTDRELAAVPESDAPGISAYRDQLSAFFGTLQVAAPPVQTLAHEKIIAKLDQVSRTFRVLILKTNLTLPYTSVFLELNCAYWTPEAEQRLRSVMAAQSGR